MNSKIAASRVSELRKQLTKAEEAEQLYRNIESAHCPICGGQLKTETYKSEIGFTVYIGASIRCSNCKAFGTEVKIEDELSCHCKGYDELTALDRAWSEIGHYAK